MNVRRYRLDRRERLGLDFSDSRTGAHVAGESKFYVAYCTQSGYRRGLLPC